MGILVWIGCRDCGERYQHKAPSTADDAYWSQFSCEFCVDAGGEGRQMQVSPVISQNTASLSRRT